MICVQKSQYLRYFHLQTTTKDLINENKKNHLIFSGWLKIATSLQLTQKINRIQLYKIMNSEKSKKKSCLYKYCQNLVSYGGKKGLQPTSKNDWQCKMDKNTSHIALPVVLYVSIFPSRIGPVPNPILQDVCSGISFVLVSILKL